MTNEIKTTGDVVRAARAGMRLKAIAARAGMTVDELKVRLEADREFKLAYENAVADYEEEKRNAIIEAEALARQNNDASLLYKINREAIKELVDRDNASRPLQVVVSADSGLLEPEYEEQTEEELAAIRARTESEANRD
ncbi:hypothetical protein WG922_07720 [Ramlibacter sp. AN1015]|uniref:hypothetical protein n=1 Tax=Ramlibacter sp. AN1015 TaxID=3133428 RepID=UPI0030BCBC22